MLQSFILNRMLINFYTARTTFHPLYSGALVSADDAETIVVSGV